MVIPSCARINTVSSRDFSFPLKCIACKRVWALLASFVSQGSTWQEKGGKLQRQDRCWKERDLSQRSRHPPFWEQRPALRLQSNDLPRNSERAEYGNCPLSTAGAVGPGAECQIQSPKSWG